MGNYYLHAGESVSGYAACSCRSKIGPVSECTYTFAESFDRFSHKIVHT